VFSAGAVAEECEITVLGAGQLGSSPLFDTVSYNPSTGDQPAQKEKISVFQLFSQSFLSNFLSFNMISNMISNVISIVLKGSIGTIN
jgi:hypothetical protein